VDGDRVYAIDATGNVICCKAADGVLVWKVNVLELAGAVNPQWGFASAPFISGEMLVVCAGNAKNLEDSETNIPPKQEGNSILALDKMTGKVIWKALDERAEYTTPMEFKSGEIDQFVVLTQMNVVGLARADGRLLWSHPYYYTGKNTNIITPIVQDDMIWIGSAYNVGSMVLQVDLKKNPTVHEVWKSKILQTHFATPILIDGYLYGYDSDRLTCVEFKTGKPMWTDTTILKGQLVYADGLFYVFGERGDLGLAWLTPQKAEFLEKMKLLPGQQRWSMPVVANGKLYVRDDKKLMCLDVKAQ
jgi:outer membrane protein assembly factor BamB